MAEQSFPVIEQPLTDDQWKSVTLGIGDGILDEGGNPYRVERSNTGDTITVQTDSSKGFNHAILRGFYHKMDAPVTLSVPAVSTDTTYWVALKYDPTNSTEPVKLGVWTSLDKANGKYYLIICSLTRKANQLLTDASLTTYRPRITPLMQVDYPENLPDPNSVLWGTQVQCWRTNQRFRASWGRWVPVSGQRVDAWAMPGWTTRYSTWDILARPTEGGWDCTMTGTAFRTAETYTIRDWSVIGLPVPDEWRPATNQYTTGLCQTTPIGVQLNNNGQIKVMPLNGGSLTIANGVDVNFSFNWFTKVDPNTTP
ncbi:hypothetical protein [Rothia koreensis]|uniref:hypothetical protein n=1 Tax=Rothia koreensis TaxID=592378 RepID=UPI003FCD9922